MDVFTRREKIMRILYVRGYETMSKLAREFDVSIKTISRDIETLSLTEPIYTKCGRYQGGVYMMQGYSPGKTYMSEDEIILLQKLLDSSVQNTTCELNVEEETALNKLITDYAKPEIGKEQGNEKQRKEIVCRTK